MAEIQTLPKMHHIPNKKFDPPPTKSTENVTIYIYIYIYIYRQPSLCPFTNE